MYAEYLYHGGDDLGVVNAAKVSFAKASTEIGAPERSLLRFLARGAKDEEWQKLVANVTHGVQADIAELLINDLKMQATHWTPFTHNSITLRVGAPVPIRTQCFKHKIGFTENEESRRYISTRPELYIPAEFRIKAANVKQGSGDTHPDSPAWVEDYTEMCSAAIDLYERMLEADVCPEQARFVLPQGCIVNWIWTGNLAAYARFYNQRTDSHAQKESQWLAKKIGTLIAPLFPNSWNALSRSVES